MSGTRTALKRTFLVDADELLRVTAGILRKLGARDDDARYMAGLIVDCDLAGHESHGVRRLPEYVTRWRSGAIAARATPRIVRDSGSLVVLDGGSGFGHLIVRDATRVAIARAQRHGIAAIALSHCDHAGRFAVYCQEAADVGVATMFFANVSGGEQQVAPPGSDEARLATNPIAFGVPRRERPHLVVDMATSVVALGRLAEELDHGSDVAAWVTPQGVLRSFGGTKGFGLAMIVEALAGAVAGAGTVGPEPLSIAQGVLTVALDVRQLRDLDSVVHDLESAISYVRGAPLIPGSQPIRMPGECTFATAAHRRVTGIPLHQITREGVDRICRELDVPPLHVCPHGKTNDGKACAV